MFFIFYINCFIIDLMIYLFCLVNLWEEIKLNLQKLTNDQIYLSYLIFIIILPISLYIFGRYKDKNKKVHYI